MNRDGGAADNAGVMSSADAQDPRDPRPDSGESEKPSERPRPRPARAPGPQKLETTLHETRARARVIPPGGIQSPFTMDDYRVDVTAMATDGTAALAPTVPEPIERPERPQPRARIEPMPMARRAPGETAPRTGLARALELYAERLQKDPTTRWISISALAVLVLVGLLSWRRSDPSISLAKLHDHPAQYDGQTVTLKGRVGEVFQMGSSYAFYLHQGRDTIVVFSRTRAPIPRDKVTITGSLSTGYLEGVPRLALFESGR